MAFRERNGKPNVRNNRRQLLRPRLDAATPSGQKAVGEGVVRVTFSTSARLSAFSVLAKSSEYDRVWKRHMDRVEVALLNW